MQKLLRKGLPGLVAMLTCVFVLIDFFRIGFHFNVIPMRTKFGSIIANLLRYFNLLYALVILLRTLKNVTSSADNSNKVIKSALFLSLLNLVQFALPVLSMGGMDLRVIFSGTRFVLLVMNVVWYFVYSAMSKRFYQQNDEE